jgi:hypothetical protein
MLKNDASEPWQSSAALDLDYDKNKNHYFSCKPREYKILAVTLALYILKSAKIRKNILNFQPAPG